MGEAMNAQQLLAAGASGALMVMFAAFYAFFFAIHRLRPSPYWPIATYSSYLLVVICALTLSWALKLAPNWQAFIVFLLVCYYFAPHLIWYLCVATHDDEQANDKDLSSNSFNLNRGDS